ncbi:hypothetical protein MIND_00653300 [Mycena indigotica]|uniref:Uncharacterized protein n=1 Tax=Mycena indigotica TaxID=2126181 RepID=A0A8H6ST42_9AGAR|nr:uncharacterized protein MIND_00653300 [Mycena indigotica]KAF7304211.1 hypothetical protein MIND_00653300 [Mycena indigotica]
MKLPVLLSFVAGLAFVAAAPIRLVVVPADIASPLIDIDHLTAARPAIAAIPVHGNSCGAARVREKLIAAFKHTFGSDKVVAAPTTTLSSPSTLASGTPTPSRSVPRRIWNALRAMPIWQAALFVLVGGLLPLFIIFAVIVFALLMAYEITMDFFDPHRHDPVDDSADDPPRYTALPVGGTIDVGEKQLQAMV